MTTVRFALTVVAGLLSSNLIAGCSGVAADFSSPKVTRENIRRVSPGMTEVEVESILGKPFLVDIEDAHHRRMDYTRPPKGLLLAKWYPMLWVHLKDGKVSEVYAKRYETWGLDDSGIYSIDAERQWESVEFERTFPK